MNHLKTYLLLLITLFIFSLVFTLPALAVVRTVGPTGTVDPTGNPIIYDRNSIQEAIDDAVNGDIIWVADGIYTENIDFGNRAITVKSKNGPRKTIINGNGKGSTVTFQSGESYDSVLQGFTIIKGSWGGIRCSDSSPTISGNIIKNNESNYGGGIRCAFYSHPLIINNFIVDNKATVYGGGIFAAWGCYPIVTNNTISNNEAIYIGGGMMSYMSSAPVVKNSIIWGNTTPKGLHVVNEVVEQNVFVYEIITHSDVQLAGGGIYSRWDTKDEENINVDPLFMDANNAIEDERDYHLQLGSPCFDKGLDISIFDFNFCCLFWTDSGPTTPSSCLACCLVDSYLIDCEEDYPKYKDSVKSYYDIDLDGNHRPSDGDRDGTTGFDMGADELGVPFYSQGPSSCDELNYKYGYRKPPPSACGGT